MIYHSFIILLFIWFSACRSSDSSANYGTQKTEISPQYTLLGYPISKPIGVPACSSTQNSKGIEEIARKTKFAVITYKTIPSLL